MHVLVLTIEWPYYVHGTNTIMTSPSMSLLCIRCPSTSGFLKYVPYGTNHYIQLWVGYSRFWGSPPSRKKKTPSRQNSGPTLEPPSHLKWKLMKLSVVNANWIVNISVSQPPGRGPVPGPGINYTGQREVLLEIVILVFLSNFHECMFYIGNILRRKIFVNVSKNSDPNVGLRKL